MNDIKYFLLLFIVFLLVSSFKAQEYYFFTEKPGQLRKTAEHASRKGDHYTAIAYYEKYRNLRPADYKVALKLAHEYRFSRDYRKAEAGYERAFEMENEKNLVARYYRAKMLMCQEEYEEAMKEFSLFRRKYRNTKANDFRRLSRIYMEGCEMAMADSIDVPGIYVDHLSNGINMAYNESSPFPFDENSMVFASLRSDTVIHYEDSAFRDSSAFKMSLFLAEKSDGKWTYRKALPGPFNHPEFDVCNVCANPERDQIYFTRCFKNWKFRKICQIYTSSLSEGSWTTPEKLGKEINLPGFTSTEPTLGVDTKNGREILYFISDRPRGKGGSDIWYSVLKEDGFSEPKNCGGRINSKGNEVSPYFDRESNSMYFSSDGYPNYGELDIFRIIGQKSKWINDPKNLGRPLNSSADDLYFILSKNPDRGFITSNREGGIALKNPTCCDDIYSFVFDEFRWITYYAVAFSDEGANSSQIFDGEVEIYIRDIENKDTTYIKTVKFDREGKLSIHVERELDYMLILRAPGFFRQSIRIPKDPEKRDYSGTDTIRVRKLTEEAIVLKNIYYPFDEWYLTEQAMIAIDSFLLQVLNLNPEIRVEISSHTDSKGGDLYNIRLSQKRAESVVQYLRKQGITRSRMIAKGYGKTKPIAPNKNPDGSDNPEGRRLNRRTEFRVIGYDLNLKSR